MSFRSSIALIVRILVLFLVDFLFQQKRPQNIFSGKFYPPTRTFGHSLFFCDFIFIIIRSALMY